MQNIYTYFNETTTHNIEDDPLSSDFDKTIIHCNIDLYTGESEAKKQSSGKPIGSINGILVLGREIELLTPENVTERDEIMNLFCDDVSFDLGYVKVDAVEAGYNKNHDRKECVGYILTFSNGATVYLSGDTSPTPEMSKLADRHLDYAFICCDGVYNMDVSEAAECARAIGAKHTIPYHMVPSDNPNGFDMSVAESFDAVGRIILQPGEELELEN